MPRRAFTLVELLVVIAIIGLLSTVAVISTTASKISTRNTKRKADLVQVSKALELYFSDNNSYPSTGGGWSGTCAGGGSKGVTGAGGWVPDLAPAYMGILPRDPTEIVAQGGACVQSWSCYLYNSNGSDYKLLANCTPEGTLSASDAFFDPTRPTLSWTVYSVGGRNW